MDLFGGIKRAKRNVVMWLDIKILASGSSGNCCYISDSKTSLLLDCGIPINQIKKGCDFKLHEIHACLVSHGH